MKSSLIVGVAALVPGLALVGCGGGGSGIISPTATPTSTSGPTLTGNTAIRAALTTGYQGYRAQVNYPIRALMMALPSTSPFKPATGALKSARLGSRTSTAQTLDYYSELGLYARVTTSGNVTTISAYTDASGTQSAGSATITSPNGTMLGNYSAYPATVGLKINITGGNIPCQGSGTLTFTGPSGVNTLTGQLSLLKTGVTSNANLSLSNSGQVSGTITLTENGQTTTLSNLSGPLDGDITGHASVSPGGSTGTAVINLLAGKYQVTLKNSSGTATASANAATGALSISFPDGSKETLANPLAVVGGANPNPTTAPTTAPTTKPTTAPTTKPTTTPTTPGTPSFYNLPIAFNDTSLAQSYLNNQNQLTVKDKFFSNAQSSPQTVKALSPYDNDNLFVAGINNQGAFIGNLGTRGDATQHGAFWKNPSTPLLLKQLNQDPVTVSSLNDSNALVGVSGIYSQVAVFWSSPTATPIALPILSDDPNYRNNSSALSISSKGQIVGMANSSGATTGVTSLVPVYWPSSSTHPQQLTPLSRPIQPVYAGINAKGNIFLADNAGTSAFYSSPTAAPQPLVLASGDGGTGDRGVRSMNASGVLVGSDIFANAYHAVRWTTGNGQPKEQDINSLIPANSGWVLTQAYSINDQGDIIGIGTLNGKYTSFYLSPSGSK